MSPRAPGTRHPASDPATQRSSDGRAPTTHRGRLIAVTGTATGIGKTHLSEALLLALRAAGRVAIGVKPVESGVVDGAVTDAARLTAASSFSVAPFGYALPDPVSPHLAARRTGVTISLPPMVERIHALRADADDVLVELPGGLFSPLSDAHLNADFLAALAPDVALLVAPDRLGVLHDTLAATRAATAVRVTFTAIALVAPPADDDSTGTNAPELRRFVVAPILDPIPRGDVRALAACAEMRALVATLPA